MQPDQPESRGSLPKENLPKAKSPPLAPATYFWIALVFLAMGSWCTYRLITDSWQGLASRAWQETPGLVLRTKVEGIPSKGGEQYWLSVVYRYTVAGKEYQNDRISYPEETRSDGTESYLKHELEIAYPVNGPCVVYVNPAHPEESCLKPGANHLFMVFWGFSSVLLLGIGLLWLWGGVATRRKRRGTPPIAG